MIQNVLRTLIGIQPYGVTSLLIFGGAFVGVVAWACLRKKSYLESMARVPLENDDQERNCQ